MLIRASSSRDGVADVGREMRAVEEDEGAAVMCMMGMETWARAHTRGHRRDKRATSISTRDIPALLTMSTLCLIIPQL